MKQRRPMTLSRRRSLSGFLFVLPFLAGFLFFVLGPVVQSAVYSFGKITVASAGMEYAFVGWENYRQALFVDTDYVRTVVENLYTMPMQLLFITIYSFFIANILNQRFHGRALARAVFFLPVIVTSGVLYVLQNSSTIISGANTALSSGQGAFDDTVGLADSMTWLLADLVSFSPTLLKVVQSAVSQIYFITTSSGVQILIFLAGLQTISPSIYEACSIEGATAWESFWKITFPMMSPIILVNCVYTIVDILGGLSNKIVSRCFALAFPGMDFGFSSAMLWMYLLIIFAILLIVTAVIRKHVYYEDA